MYGFEKLLKNNTKMLGFFSKIVYNTCVELEINQNSTRRKNDTNTTI